MAREAAMEGKGKGAAGSTQSPPCTFYIFPSDRYLPRAPLSRPPPSPQNNQRERERERERERPHRERETRERGRKEGSGSSLPSPSAPPPSPRTREREREREEVVLPFPLLLLLLLLLPAICVFNGFGFGNHGIKVPPLDCPTISSFGSESTAPLCLLLNAEAHATMDNSTEIVVHGEKRRPTAGCSFRAICSAVFHRRSRTLPRRPTSAAWNPSSSVSRAAAKLAPFSSGRPRAGPDQAPLVLNAAGLDSPARAEEKRLTHRSQVPGQQIVARQQARPAAPVPTISMELDSMIYDHQRAKESSALIRASSGNVMLFGHLGNLRVPNAAVAPARNRFDDLPKTANKTSSSSGGTRHQNVRGETGSAMGSSLNAKEPVSTAVAPAGNLLDDLPKTAKKASSSGETRHSNVGGGTASGMDRRHSAKATLRPPICRTLSNKLVPEELNHMGSVEYRKGKLAEALAFFEQATIISPGRALYWNNKAVVLTGLGRLLEAVAGCREAVKIDPSYCRAHYRLAILYFRLGEAERALHHYQQAGGEANATDMARARSLQNHLTKCCEARKGKYWHSMVKEAQSAMFIGAHSAPKVFASQAEALLRLQRHQEAESTLVDAPTFDIDASTKFFGAATNAYVLVVRAQVDMALGRFCDAVSNAQRAARIDPRNMEIAAVVRRACAVSLAQTNGNNLLNASKFAEACAAYGEGLDHDPQNSVLLCNRAACQSKLGQWEKAIEDCNVALSVRPSYKKARLRRAGCHAKLERWEDSMEDYKVLIQQLPGDGEVLQALAKVHSHLKGRDAEKEGINPSANTVVNVKDQFTHLST